MTLTRALVAGMIAAASFALYAQPVAPVGEWRYIGGDVQHTRYSDRKSVV